MFQPNFRRKTLLFEDISDIINCQNFFLLFPFSKLFEEQSAELIERKERNFDKRVKKT